jgi:hypothetical protein
MAFNAAVCDRSSDRFVGVCSLPPSPGVSPREAVEELERCVKEFGFVGCNLNPDPSGGYWTGPPLGDESWYPLYAKLEELGEYRHCPATEWFYDPKAIRYGYTSMDTAPGLWGGFSHYLYLPMNAVLHKVPEGLTPEETGLATPMSNGIQWALMDGGVGFASTVLIQGPGQQGLCCLMASKQAGAAKIIVTGTSRDTRRLEVARACGADAVVDVEKENDWSTHAERDDAEERTGPLVPRRRARVAHAGVTPIPVSHDDDPQLRPCRGRLRDQVRRRPGRARGHPRLRDALEVNQQLVDAIRMLEHAEIIDQLVGEAKLLEEIASQIKKTKVENQKCFWSYHCGAARSRGRLPAPDFIAREASCPQRPGSRPQWRSRRSLPLSPIRSRRSAAHRLPRAMPRPDIRSTCAQ